MVLEVRQQPLRLVQLREVQLHHNVVGVSDRPADPVRQDAGGSPADRVTVEGRFPRGEVGDGVFDLQRVHGEMPFPSRDSLAGLLGPDEVYDTAYGRRTRTRRVSQNSGWHIQYEAGADRRILGA